MDLLPSTDIRQLLAKAVDRQAPEAARGADQLASVLGKDSSLIRSLTPEAQQAGKAAASKKVMITYLSTGNGHRTAAEAVYCRLHELHPDWQVSKPIDMANVSKVSKASTYVFEKAVKWGLWPKLFALADRFSGGTALAGLRRRFDLLGSGKFIDNVRAQNPDVIVHTNFIGSEIQAAARESGRIPQNVENVQVVTDMVGYGMYLGAHADLTLAPNLQVAEELEQKGMEARHIAITGIPINPVFAQPADRAAARATLGFAPDAKVLLAQGNLIEDPSYFEHLMQQLAKAYPNGAQGKPIQVAVACGKDQPLYDQLQTLAKSYHGKVTLKPLGFLNPSQMRDVMSASDLTLTKPGGLTTSESVAMNLPMVLVDVLGGGQETRNAAFFAQHGAGVTAHNFDEAIGDTVSLLGQPQRLNAMRQAAGRVAQPNAATKVADVIAHLPAEPSQIGKS
ncbi:MAG TPA: glycosyltransferase [Oscillatoriaceae cyanobacterium]